MPVILSREAEVVWLGPTVQRSACLLPLLKRYPVEEMEPYPVSTKVNSPANDGPECIEPLPLRDWSKDK